MKIAIHVHVYYPELWEELWSSVENIIRVAGADNVYLVVTVSEGQIAALEKVRTAKFACRSEIAAVPNRGYDVGPFVCEFLNKLDLDRFDLIVKLHTKRSVDSWMNFRPLRGAQWRTFLLSFCRSERAFLRTLQAFGKYEKLGFVSHNRVINHCGSDWGENVAKVQEKLAADFGVKANRPVTISGTMFCARAALFKIFQGRYRYDDFTAPDQRADHRDYGLAADLEYAFTLYADSLGFTVSAGIFPPAIAEFGYAVQSALFLSVRAVMRLVRKFNQA